MSASPVRLTVFTKPWREKPLAELASFVKELGLDGVELPVRPGFQVTPETVAAGLPEAVKVFAAEGLEIASVAGPTDEATIAACAEARVPVIRVCEHMRDEGGYMAAEAKLREKYDALVPLLESYGVTLGLQNHCDLYVANAMGILHLIESYDPKHIAAVWDPAHCALDGEVPEAAADILWPHLCMVNLKNAVWVRKTGPDAEVAQWEARWVAGREGLCNWPTVATILKERGYLGPVCLTAEYGDSASVDRLVAEDIAFARSLFSEEPPS